MEFKVTEIKNFKAITPIIDDDEIMNPEHLKSEIINLIEFGNKNIIVDFSQISYISSRIIGILMSVHKIMVRYKGKFVLMVPNSKLQEILSTMGVDKMIPVYKTMEEITESAQKETKVVDSKKEAKETVLEKEPLSTEEEFSNLLREVAGVPTKKPNNSDKESDKPIQKTPEISEEATEKIEDKPVSQDVQSPKEVSQEKPKEEKKGLSTPKVTVKKTLSIKPNTNKSLGAKGLTSNKSTLGGGKSVGGVGEKKSTTTKPSVKKPQLKATIKINKDGKKEVKEVKKVKKSKSGLFTVSIIIIAIALLGLVGREVYKLKFANKSESVTQNKDVLEPLNLDSVSTQEKEIKDVDSVKNVEASKESTVIKQPKKIKSVKKTVAKRRKRTVKPRKRTKKTRRVSKASFSGKTGTIFIATRPALADIYLDGKLVGISNKQQVTAPVGKVKLTFKKNGITMVKEYDIKPGKNKPTFEVLVNQQ